MQLSQLGHRNLSSHRDVFTFEEFFKMCETDPMCYATIHERLLKAIGEPVVIETVNDKRLSRIFHNRIIRMYETFADFHGMEGVIEKVVNFLKHAAQGLEARKQVLYLLGPVGGGKSSFAERIKALAEVHPIYVLAIERGGKLEISPVFEHPFGIVDPSNAKTIEAELGIPARYFGRIPSPWAVKRLTEEFDGDLTRFKVVRVTPSQLKQVAVCKTEPGDENNQDISSLVGKIDIRKLEMFAQDDADAYAYSGGLCRANQGVMEFVEMFKAPIKVLHPLLTATQEGNYKGTEGLGAIPFEGLVFAHSNEAEWEAFKKKKDNEAFIDRITLVDVPYCLRIDEEVKIYKKILGSSALANAPCAPKTLEIMAQFAVLDRIVDPKGSSIFSKMHIYNGEDLKSTDPKAKSHQEYQDHAGPREGMSGLSTRAGYKVLADVFNFDGLECAANPVHLFYVLDERIRTEHGLEGNELTDEGKKRQNFLKEYIVPRYQEFIGKEIQTAYVESYSEYGQNLFDRYIQYADFWIQEQDFRDPDSGDLLDRKQLDAELEKIEKPAGISNPKDFRNEVVNFVLRQRANNGGANPVWTSYQKLKEVIEKGVFTDMEKIMPVISFNAKATTEDAKKHQDFLERMSKSGYTAKQVRLLVEWYTRSRKSS